MTADPVARLPVAVRAEWAELARPTPSARPFDPDSPRGLPEPARRWLAHAIAPGTPLGRRVVLEQHGRIRIGAWRDFRARQVIAGLEGYVWACATRVRGVPVYGYDRLAHGTGAMVHRAFGRVALVDESGSDLTRSAAGRLAAEIIWTPAAALDPDVAWRAGDTDNATALLPCGDEVHEVTLAVGPSGALPSVTTPRWASVGGGPYRLHPFAAEVHDEGKFDGWTVPTRVTAGYDDEPFVAITVDGATYR